MLSGVVIRYGEEILCGGEAGEEEERERKEKTEEGVGEYMESLPDDSAASVFLAVTDHMIGLR